MRLNGDGGAGGFPRVDVRNAKASEQVIFTGITVYRGVQLQRRKEQHAQRRILQIVHSFFSTRKSQ
jgi:hypothetical protein